MTLLVVDLKAIIVVVFYHTPLLPLLIAEWNQCQSIVLSFQTFKYTFILAGSFNLLINFVVITRIPLALKNVWH